MARVERGCARTGFHSAQTNLCPWTLAFHFQDRSHLSHTRKSQSSRLGKDNVQEQMKFSFSIPGSAGVTFSCRKKDDTACILYNDQRNLSIPTISQRTSNPTGKKKKRANLTLQASRHCHIYSSNKDSGPKQSRMSIFLFQSSKNTISRKIQNIKYQQHIFNQRARTTEQQLRVVVSNPFSVKNQIFRLSGLCSNNSTQPQQRENSQR